MHKDSSCDYDTAVSTQNAESGINTLKGMRNKCYSLDDVVEQHDNKATVLEHAFSHDDSRQAKRMESILMQCVSLQQDNANDNVWNPFLFHNSKEVSEVLQTAYYCCDQEPMSRTTELCTGIICYDIVGVQSFSDMLFCICPAEYQHVKNKYMVYCQMSLESPSKSFLFTGFNFDSNEKKDFDQACHSVFCQILSIVF